MASTAPRRGGRCAVRTGRSTALLAVQAGDHILVGDNVYRSTRNFCNGVLTRYGVETTYFDPLIGTAIAKPFKPNTRAVMRENVEDLKADLARGFAAFNAA